jgi:HD-like signal output (HDOD) protein/signal transduction histidine kinase
MVYPPSASMETRIGNRSPIVPASVSRDIRSKLPLERLPMMPQVLVRLLDLCHRDNVNFSDIAVVIHRDAAMTAKVIAVASSASQYGRSRPTNLDQCLTMLGMSTIKTIVINESVLQVFRRFTMDRDFDLRQFWGHSLRCALLARELATIMDYANKEEAYLGGLMHDVGQLAILAADANAYFPLLHTYGDNDELCQREQETFDLTHAEIGAWLVEKWEFDSFLSDAVLYHHDPAERVVAAHKLVRIIFLANRLSACTTAPGQAEIDLAGLCGASGVDLQLLLAKVEQELAKLAEQMGIELAETPPADAVNSESSKNANGVASNALAARVRDVILVENVLGDTLIDDGLEASLQAISQSARVLFGVHPAICFLPQSEDPARFVAHPVGSRWAKASQLEFILGRSGAEVARAIDQGVLLLAPGVRPQNLLDEQLLRLIGGTGLVIVPLRSQQACHGVLVAGFENAVQAEAFLEQSPCFEHFGRMAGDLLHKTRTLPDSDGPSQSNPGVDALRSHVRQVVHEIGNPLSIIQNYLSTLETKYTEGDGGGYELGIVKEEISRVAKILQTILQEPGAGQPETGAIKLNQLIQDLVALCSATGLVAGSVDIQTDLFADPPALWSDVDRLKQLLLNLLKNAMEAVSAGGAEGANIVRVSTAPWGSSKEPSHIEIRIEDSGPGIPSHILDHFYQPVLSTKGQGHLGVGLAVVGELVRDLHGLINCQSNERGTRFQLLLPLGKR